MIEFFPLIVNKFKAIIGIILKAIKVRSIDFEFKFGTI